MAAPFHFDSANFLVLHALRCIGFTSSTRVSEATGISESDVESELIDLAVDGLVTKIPGDFGGWGLTDAGRAADAERSSAALEKAGTRSDLVAAFDKFMVLNPELLDLCTAWQMRRVDGAVTLNDHSDREYDSRVLGRLVDFNERANVVCAELATALGRFKRYQDRLTGAITRAEAGELEYVTDNLSSYHVVWFQLHEDLLATLGIPRR
ncbi:transcriptional regulator [Streptosporangium carneum]|uniref:Uncharacterized protein n=1 Tax=Streptosporangium carneum TaxID=47481 RepID=A0A9W6I0A3_9ACTN|nr:transcriptional regulator [Streptosporangium carneum]GLK09348.1 hypothetical protein GCM10017600_27540 [Streptosporangium carneum]